MAGYFNKLMGYMYDGCYVAGEELENGIFVKVAAGKATASAGASLKMKVLEKTDFAGKPAIEVLVVNQGTEEIYMVENLFDFNDGAAYDAATYKIPAGAHVRLRRPENGDHMIITVTDELYASLAVDASVVAGAKGILAAE